MRKRLLLVIALCLLATTFVSRVSPVKASTFPPKNTSGLLVGFDSPLLSSKQYAYVNMANGHVIELYFIYGTHWKWADLTQAIGAPPVNVSARPTLAGFYSPGFKAKHYAYFATNGDLIDMYSTLSHPAWRFTDTFQSSGHPSSGDGQYLLGFASQQFSSIRYVWTNIDGTIDQVYSTDGANWSTSLPMDGDNGNATEFAGTGNALTVGFDSVNYQAIQFAYAYQSPDSFNGQGPAVGHLIEAYTQTGNGSGAPWHFNDLTSFLSAPPIDGAMVGFDANALDSKQYAYLDASGHIQEMYIQGSGWQLAKPDLSTVTGAPTARSNSPLAGFASDRLSAKFYSYVALNGDVELLEFSTALGHWVMQNPDPSAETTAPTPDFNSPLISFDAPQIQSLQLVFYDANGDIQELYLPSGTTQWQRGDLSTIATLN